MLATGLELSQADSSLLNINRKLYLRELLEKDGHFLPIMKQITNEYNEIVTQKNNEAGTIEAGKFISLVIGILCLILLVLEPALKRGQFNYNELQKARNELLLEKKQLASILQSQTNYVIRINRQGNFTYANPSFLKTFGYLDDEILHTQFFATIFPKDIIRCEQVADTCWQEPGKIVQLLIRKPFKNSKQFLWTEWEFLALTAENGEVLEIQGIGLNVTDKVQHQQVKEEAIQTLSYAMTYARMGSWKLDFITQEIELSREFKALLAIPEEESNHIAFEEFLNQYVVPEDLTRVLEEITRMIRHKNDNGFETSFSFRIITREGWMRYLFIRERAGEQ
jgi:PAS domain S-box-containing protein